MKIVTTHHPEKIHLTGMFAALSTVTQVIIWIPENKPVFDMIAELQPDIIICLESDMSQSLNYAAKTHNIQLVVCQENYPRAAVNLAQLYVGETKECYKSDILYISNQIVEEDFVELLQGLVKYKLKICGPVILPIPQYIGLASAYTTTGLLKSTIIAIDYNEGVLWDAAINKVFCLSNIKNELFPTFTNIANLHEQINHFLKDEKHRQFYIKQAYKLALNNTHFHAASQLCQNFDKTLAQQLLNKIEEVING